MTADACATCGHPPHKAECYDCIRYDLREVCTAYLPPRPVPEEAELCETPMKGFYGADTLCARPKGHDGKHYQLRDHTPATVPAPHTEAERAYVDWSGDHHNRLPREQAAFVAGYIRAKEDDA